jgi:two-component system, OmpR family, sensor histidine kinase ChvG
MTGLSGRGWEGECDPHPSEDERRGFWRFFQWGGFQYRFTSLTGRIIVLNLFGLAILVGGILYLNQFREGLIEARAKSLMTQGEIIASAIAQNSTLDAPDRPMAMADADNLIDLPPDASADRTDESLASLAFHINPEQITALVQKLIKATSGARARIYDRDGNLLMDTSALYSRGQIMRFDLPTVTADEPGFWTGRWLRLRSWMQSSEVPLYKDIGAENGKAYEEVMIALNGAPTKILKVNAKGETIISFAAPIQRMRAVFGVLLMTTRDDEIDDIIAKENAGIMRIALLVVAVTVLLSTLLAGTIAGPMHRLAIAAERVRTSIKTREQIPDFTDRKDEIGHLSRALRDMTSALYSRIDAIESFAADVAHELKNPLTSLRSAADTLPLAKTEENQKRLLTIIQHDVRRLDRLITDISDASRLDAEMAREACKPVNMAGLLDAICSIVNDIHRKGAPPIILKMEGVAAGKSAEQSIAYMVSGHDSRLSQVINNIIDNAMSFSPKGGKIYVSARRLRKNQEIEIVIEDEGPGVSPENLEKVFIRFYTDRPAQEEFGQNSGLGLHISRQIIEAHGGRIWAENRRPRKNGDANGAQPGGGKPNGASANSAETPASDREPSATGARFVIRLPTMPPANSRA